MRVGFITHCLPLPDVSGGAMTCWAIIKSLRQAGHEIDVYYLKEEADRGDTPERRAVLAPHVRRLEVIATPTESQILAARGSRGRWGRIMDQLISPPFELLYPSYALRNHMAEEFKENPVDLLFCYHWSAAASVHGLHPAPKMIATGDLSHRPSVARWELMKPEPTLTYLKSTTFALRDKIHRTRGMIKLLKDGDDVGSFGYFDAEWLRKKGEPRSRYFLTPIEDPIGPGWKAKRTSGHNPKFKIITAISNLQSTSTKSAMTFVAKEMMPTLERELGQDKFEIHVIGTGTPPPEMQALLPRPNIVMRGYVPDIEPEFLSADIVLSPTPVFLGFRIRVITGFAFGACVVAHRNEAINMPEMVHGKNALLGSTGPELAAQVIRAYKDAALRAHLGNAARDTYDSHFNPEISGKRLVREMEAVAGKKEAVRA